MLPCLVPYAHQRKWHHADFKVFCLHSLERQPLWPMSLWGSVDPKSGADNGRGTKVWGVESRGRTTMWVYNVRWHWAAQVPVSPPLKLLCSCPLWPLNASPFHSTSSSEKHRIWACERRWSLNCLQGPFSIVLANSSRLLLRWLI